MCVPLKSVVYIMHKVNCKNIAHFHMVTNLKKYEIWKYCLKKKTSTQENFVS